MDIEALDRRLAEIHRGRRWIVPSDVAASVAETVTDLRRWGAADVLVVAGAVGVGEAPDAGVHMIAIEPGTSIMEGLRRFADALARPSPELAAAVDAFDPAGDALVLASPFDSGDRLLGRRLYGARRPEWAALEDKTLIDAVWDRAGIQRVESAVVPLDAAPHAAGLLDGGRGTVWAIDNREGWHGGAEGTRWVPVTADAPGVVEDLKGRTDVVRVMPFLEGVPCSIHGFVTADGVGVFRPIELLVMRTSDHRFRYAGISGLWDAPRELTAEMRTAARNVGAFLHREVGYLGPFSIDGVATVDGFRPTELNPRLAVGLGIQTSAVEGLSLGGVTRSSWEGDLEVDVRWFERLVLDAARTRRNGRMGLIVGQAVSPARQAIAFGDGVAVAVGDGQAEADLTVGPAVNGSYVLMRFRTDHVPVGELMAPYAASAAALAAGMWGLDVPVLTPAPDVFAR